MLRGILTLCVLLCSSFAWSRDIPKDADIAVLKKVELPYMTLGNGGFSWLKLLTFGIADGNTATVQISRFVRIHDENDRFIVMGRLAGQTGKIVAVKRDNAGVAREIWFLDDAEALNYQNKAEQNAQ